MANTLNIRQKINLSSRDPQLVVLEQHGIVSENGNITALGRRIQGDLLLRGESADVAGLVEAVLGVYRAEKAVENVLAEANDTDEETQE